MEKLKEQKEKQPEKGKATVWDCGSSLYDSFELKSFERQLDSAISSARSLSMPHLTDNHRRQAAPPPPLQRSPQAQPPAALSKKSSKISRSLHKLIRSIFRPKPNSHSFQVQETSQNGVYVVYDRYGALATIPEVPENISGAYDHAGLSPEVRSLVGRSASDRFTAASIGISCA